MLGSLLHVLCFDRTAQHNQASVRKGNYLENDWQHTLASPDSFIKSDMAVPVVGITVSEAVSLTLPGQVLCKINRDTTERHLHLHPVA